MLLPLALSLFLVSDPDYPDAYDNPAEVTHDPTPLELVEARALLAQPLETPILKGTDIYQLRRNVMAVFEIDQLYSYGAEGFYGHQEALDSWRETWQLGLTLPPIEDAARFPPYRITGPNVRFNFSYQDRLLSRLRFEPDRGDVIRQALAEAKDLNDIWILCGRVNPGPDASQDVLYRRIALLALKSRLTEDEYATGTLPPCVPLNRFTDVTKKEAP